MRLEEEELGLPAAQGIRLVALALLDEAQAARARLVGEWDDEALHDFRVAVRRTRSWVRAFGDELARDVRRKDQKQLKRVASATNPGRDLEVQLAWLRDAAPRLPARARSIVKWMDERLVAQAERPEHDAAAEIDDEFPQVHERLTDALSAVNVPVRPGNARRHETLATTVGQRLGPHAEILRELLGRVRSVEDEHLAHEARIAAKRLRYLLEPVAPHVDDGNDVLDRLKSLQDTLGRLHDAHVMALELRVALEEVATMEARRVASQVLAGDAPANGSPAPRRERSRRSALIGLATLLRADMDANFAELRSSWLQGGTDELIARVGAVAARLGASHDEVERKYLLDTLPDRAREAPHREIEQGYLPGTVLHERVRRETEGEKTRHWRTMKLGKGVRRVQIEEETTAEMFSALWRLTRGMRVRKRRWLVIEGDRTWEVDEFLDRPLVVAEIELGSADEEVALPDWLAPHVVREVTTEDEYQNVNLAK